MTAMLIHLWEFGRSTALHSQSYSCFQQHINVPSLSLLWFLYSIRNGVAKQLVVGWGNDSHLVQVVLTEHGIMRSRATIKWKVIRWLYASAWTISFTIPKDQIEVPLKVWRLFFLLLMLSRILIFSTASLKKTLTHDPLSTKTRLTIMLEIYTLMARSSLWGE